MYELQQTIEETYGRKHIIEKVLADIDDSFEIKYRLLDTAEKVEAWVNQEIDSAYESKAQRLVILKHLSDMNIFDLVLDIFVKVIQVQRTSYQAVAGMIGPVLGYSNTIDGVKTVAEVMAIMVDNDLIDAILPMDSEEGVLMVESKYVLNQETIDFINQTQYLPPMLCPPNPVTSKIASQYLTFKESVILGSAVNSATDKPLALDVLNILNQQKWKLDRRMVQFEETPNKELDTHQKREQFEQLKKSSRHVYDLLLEHSDKPFYWTHKFDKRGRVYTQGYHMNIQSTDFKKSLISLPQPIKVTV